MFPKIRANIIFRFTIDILMLIISFIITHIVVEKSEPFEFSRLDILLLLFSIFIWYFIARLALLYEDYRSRSFAYELVSISKVVLLHYLLLSLVLFLFFPSYPYPRSFTLVNTVSLLLLVSMEKFLLKRYFRVSMKSGTNIKKVIIVGAGEVGINFWKTLEMNNHFGYRLEGFVDDMQQQQLNGEYLGSIQDFKAILTQRPNVEDIVIALPNNATEKIQEVITVSEQFAKRVRIIPDFYRFGSGKFSISNFGTFPLVTIRSLPLDEPENKLLKRFFDISISILFFICCSLFFPGIALLIKLSSKGNVFFKQERWGLNNKKIICYKFRTMAADSSDTDEAGIYRQATKNDSRITSIGRFLRKSNIDELPQFWNVLKGDMSLVGPRPHPTPLNMESKDVIQNYMLRHLIKPGITGWAQVNGYRGETKEDGLMQKRVDLDLWYIENWSFWLDWQIILQTLINMCIGDKNAY